MKTIIITLSILSALSMYAQNSIAEKDILATLDYCNQDGLYTPFIPLGNPYSYLIDCRLNIFRSDNGKWAIAAERLGYNPRGGHVELEIYYYGNCLKNLTKENNSFANYYSVPLFDEKNYERSVEGEALKPDAKFWTVHGQHVPLSLDKKEYAKAGITLNEYEPGEVRIEEAARLAIIKYRDVFRATDVELYKSIPANLTKILVLDEWYHKDFDFSTTEKMTDQQIQKSYEISGSLKQSMTINQFMAMVKKQEATNEKNNKNQWDNNRPGSYETWQLIAKVIANNNPALYKPTVQPNTHWSNWPDSGGL